MEQEKERGRGRQGEERGERKRSTSRRRSGGNSVCNIVVFVEVAVVLREVVITVCVVVEAGVGMGGI